MKSIKRFFSLLTLCLAMIVFAFNDVSQAQTAAKKQGTFYVSPPVTQFTMHVDSLQTDSTASFSFYGYDAESFVTYPVSYAKLLSSAGTPKVTLTVEGNYGIGWTAIDTILTTDSVKTLSTGTLDLNNKHCPWYRLKAVGTAGNRRDTYLDIVLYVSKRSF